MNTSTNHHPDRFDHDAANGADQDEARALKHFHRDIGMNYDAGFGSLLCDSAAADVASVDREHPVAGDRSE
jgi:hypothetical protein